MRSALPFDSEQTVRFAPPLGFASGARIRSRALLRSHSPDSEQTVRFAPPLGFASLLRSALCVVFLVTTLAGVQEARAQATLRLSVDRQLVARHEAVQVTVQLSIDGRAGYSQYVPPTMKGLRVSSGGMSSQNIEVVNWRVRRREVYSYTAYPMQLGRLKIGPAAIRVGGRWVRSNVATITVQKGVAGARRHGGGMGTPPPDNVSPGHLGTPQVGNGKVLPRVFIGGKATPQKAYVGQQIVARWDLYTQSDVLGFRTRKQPTTDGFWADDLRSPRKLRFARKRLGNRQYYAAVLAKKALFPQRPGKLKIGPMAAAVRTLHTFSSSAELASETLEIEVLPLPAKGKPKGFPEQNVGRYSMTAMLDRRSVKAGDAVTLKLVIRGVGNLKQLVVPKLRAVEGLKIYEPKSKERISNNERIQGEKTLEYLLLPTRGGKIRIPALELPYFDPKAKRYRKARSKAITLTVRGKIPGAHAGSGASKSNVLARDIRPPKAAKSLSHRAQSGPFTPLRLGLVLFPLTVLLLIAGGEWLKARLARQTERSLGRQVARRVRQHLSSAREAQKKGDAAACFGALALALQEQLDHQMGERVEGLTREGLRETMATAGFAPALIDEVVEELDNCDFARFAPSASEGRQLEEALDRCRGLLRQIGRTRVQKRPKTPPKGESTGGVA